MLPGFQVQCCVNGKSKNYVSFTYCHPSGMEGRWQLIDLAECWNYYRTLWSFQIDHIILCPCCQSISTCLPFSHLKHLFSMYIYIDLYITLHSLTHDWPPCYTWTWPQSVNILPLVHPLCRYNDHLTVTSKGRRKLGRRRQRGQQHWTNYVPFSPSILTLMKSLIIRGKRKVGRGGQVRKMYIVHLS